MLAFVWTQNRDGRNLWTLYGSPFLYKFLGSENYPRVVLLVGYITFFS